MSSIAKKLEDQSNKTIITKLALGVAGTALVYWGLNRLFGGKTESKDDFKEGKQEQQSPRSQKSSLEKPSTKLHENETPTPIQRESDEEIKKQILKRIMQQIQVPVKTDLDIDSLDLIYMESLNLAARIYQQTTRQNRELRRRVMKTNVVEYQQLIMVYNDQVDKILDDAQNQILAAIGLQTEKFEEMVVNLMEEGNYQKIFMMQSNIRQKIKSKIPSNQEITLDKVKDVLSYQVNVFKNKPKYLSAILDKLKADQNLNAITIHIVIQDEIYNKFKLEEEDTIQIMGSEQFENDPDINLLLADLQSDIFQLIGPEENYSASDFSEIK